MMLRLVLTFFLILSRNEVSQRCKSNEARVQFRSLMKLELFFVRLIGRLIVRVDRD